MKRRLACLLALALCLFMPAWAEEDILINAQVSGEIVIDLSSRIVYRDEPTLLEVKVEYEETVPGDILLVNDLGEVLHTVKNDGSGSVQVEVELRENEIREGWITGVCGEIRSEEIHYRVQPRVTEAMTQALTGVLSGMKAALEEAQITDGDSPEAYDAVCAYLAGDARVEWFGANEGSILFQTTDGLMGFYGFHDPEEFVFGGEENSPFLSAEDAFERYEAGTLPGGALVASEIPMTNEKILFISPEEGDRVIDWGRSVYDPRLRALATEAAYEYENVTGAAALDRLFRGDFNDCGLLVFMAHGSRLKTDRGYMLVINLGSPSPEQLLMMNDALWERKNPIGFDEDLRETTDPTRTAQSIYINDESAHVLYGLSQDEYGSYVDQVLVTRNYLAHVLQDKSFDNTIAFFNVCYAACDPGMRDLILGKGASAYIGTVDPMVDSTSYVAAEQLCDMVRKLEDGTYTTLQEAIDRIGEQPDDEQLKAYYQSRREMGLTGWTEEEFVRTIRESYPLEQQNNAVLCYLRTVESGGRVLLGEGTITGKVVTGSGTGVSEAKVSFYRWLNHSFRQEPDNEFVVYTDENGEYKAENMPYGQYIVKAEKNDGEAFVHVTADDLTVKAEDIRLSQRQIIVTTEVETYESNTMTSLLVTPTVYVTDNPEAMDRINARLWAICDEMRAEQLALREKPAEKPGQLHACDLNVKEIFSSGSLLFITLDEYRYTSGAARGWSFSTSLAFDAETGEAVDTEKLFTENPDALNALVGLAAEKLKDKYGRDLWISADEAARDALQGSGGSWKLTEKGLMVHYSAGSIAPQFIGQVKVELPYESLYGALPEKYLPAPSEEDGSASISFSFTEADFGKPGACVLAADGAVKRVKVLENWEGYDMGQRFYADALYSQTAHLPELGEGDYQIEYISNGEEVVLTVK